jgi:hypothetical protein
VDSGIRSFASKGKMKKGAEIITQEALGGNRKNGIFECEQDI